MATSFTFNNQVVELPGSYSQFVSGVTNPSLSLSYGNVLLIDTGEGEGYGAGAGISGTLASGAKAIYQAETLKQFRDAVGGGILWDIAEKLFQPNGPGGGNGISKLFYARAAATVAAEATLNFTAGANGGTAVIQVKNEGTVGNGVEGDQVLATATYTVTATGANGDTHTLKINEGAGAITIATAAKTASETTTALMAAKIAAGVTNGYSAVANGSTVIVTARNPKGLEKAADWNSFTESYVVTGTATGTAGNFAGGVSGSVLTRGYAITMSAGVDDPTKFVVEFWRGTYKGVDVNGYVWDEVAEVSTLPVLIAKSPEFLTITELHTWMETNSVFGSSFKLKTKTVVGNGTVVTGDLTANAGNNKFANGTTTYNTSHLDTILEQVQLLDYSLVLCDKYADNAQHTNNGKILAHISDGDTFGDKLMVVGGGEDENKFSEGTSNSSIETAKYYDNDRVIVAHGGPIKNTTLVSDGYISRTSLHKAAAVCGRLAGLAPQTPVTFKTIKFDGERHKLSLKEQKQGLKKGVLMTINDGSVIRVLQGVNSIQENNFLLNSNATTHSIQLRRIIAQLNKELVVNATDSLLKNPNGTNRNTLSITDVVEFTKSFLGDRVATTTLDNMVISYRNVNATLVGDSYKVTYEVVLNTEITKLFFTGTVFLN